MRFIAAIYLAVAWAVSLTGPSPSVAAEQPDKHTGNNFFVKYRNEELDLWNALNDAIQNDGETNTIVGQYLEFTRKNATVYMKDDADGAAGQNGNTANSDGETNAQGNPDRELEDLSPFMRMNEIGIVYGKDFKPEKNSVAYARLAVAAGRSARVFDSLVKLATPTESFAIATLLAENMTSAGQLDGLSRQLLERQARSDSLCAFRLGQMEQHGLGGAKNIESAIEHLRFSAETQPAAALALASIYEDGGEGQQDLIKAEYFYSKAIALAKPDPEEWKESETKAAFVADLIQSRVDTASEFLTSNRGKALLRTAAKDNSYLSLALAKFLICPDCGAVVDVASAATWLRYSSNSGNAEATYLLLRLLVDFPTERTTPNEAVNLRKKTLAKIRNKSYIKEEDLNSTNQWKFAHLIEILDYDENNKAFFETKKYDTGLQKLFEEICRIDSFTCSDLAYRMASGAISERMINVGFRSLKRIAENEADANLALMDLYAYYGDFEQAKKLAQELSKIRPSDEYKLRNQTLRRLVNKYDTSEQTQLKSLLSLLSEKGDDDARVMIKLLDSNDKIREYKPAILSIKELEGNYFGEVRLGYSRRLSRSASLLSQAWAAEKNFAKALDYNIVALNVDVFLEQIAGVSQGPLATKLANACHLSQSSMDASVFGFYPFAIQTAKRALSLVRPSESILNNMPLNAHACFKTLNSHHYRWLAGLLEHEGRKREATAVLNLLGSAETALFFAADDLSLIEDDRSIPLNQTEKEAQNLIDKVSAPVWVGGRRLYELNVKSSKYRLSATELREAKILNKQMDEREQRMRTSLQNVRKYYEKISKVIPRDEVRSLLDLVDVARRIEGQLRRQDSKARRVALLHYAVLPNRMFAIVTTAEGQNSYDWTSIGDTPFSERLLNAKIDAFRSALRNPVSDIVTPAQEMYNILIKPLEGELSGADVLLVSSDRQLHNVPFAALRAPNYYLAERITVSSITSASLSNVTERTGKIPHLVAFGASASTGSLPPLKAVELEVKSLVKRDGSDKQGLYDGYIYLNSGFNEKSLKTGVFFGSPDERGYVHVATHFVLGERESASFLMLGNGDRFSMNQFMASLDLRNTELVTLSACETAFSASGLRAGPLTSLATVAERAGAQAVVASLWNVNDLSTAALMYAFYEELHDNGMASYADALAVAQRRMLSGVLPDAWMHSESVRMKADELGIDDLPSWASGLSHPYYWAPFIVIGR